MKKVISIVSMLCLTFMISVPSFAVSADVVSTDVADSIVEALETVECDKTLWGLEDVDFSDIYIGNAIYAYDYIDGTFKKSNEIYPLFSSNDLIAFSIPQDDVHQQIVTALVKEIKCINPEQLALVYDSKSCYLYDGFDFYLLAESQEIIFDRDILPSNAETLNLDVIKLSRLIPARDLGYVTPTVREQTYFACSIDYVSQPRESDLCWAACIACISNYVKGTNLTAQTVANETCGEGYLGPVGIDVIPRMMKNEFGLSYSYKDSVPSDLVILNNIKKDYPVLISLRGKSGINHLCVTYGINVVSGYVTIMDPMFGFTTVYTKNNEYTYTDPTRDRTWTFDSGICRYWSA